MLRTAEASGAPFLSLLTAQGQGIPALLLQVGSSLSIREQDSSAVSVFKSPSAVLHSNDEGFFSYLESYSCSCTEIYSTWVYRHLAQLVYINLSSSGSPSGYGNNYMSSIGPNSQVNTVLKSVGLLNILRVFTDLLQYIHISSSCSE